MSSTDVVAYEAASLNERMQYARTLAAAGDLIPKGLWATATNVNGVFTPAAPSPGKILLVMETGAMLGMHPMAALQSIDVIEGRATLAARLIAGLIRKAGNRLEIIKSGSIPGGDYSVTVIGTITDTGEKFESTWDIPRAIRAGLVTSYQKNSTTGEWEVRARTEKGHLKPWEAYAESMPVWRAISEVGREGFSDVTLGLYSTEELTDGGVPIPVAEPEPEATEDWPALIAAAETREALDEIGERLQSKGEGTDKLRAAWLARAGFLAREANTVDAEIVTDTEDPSAGEASPDSPAEAPGEETQEEYEARVAAEFDAAAAAEEGSDA